MEWRGSTKNPRLIRSNEYLLGFFILSFICVDYKYLLFQDMKLLIFLKIYLEIFFNNQSK